MLLQSLIFDDVFFFVYMRNKAVNISVGIFIISILFYYHREK
jgi:hypothetical protein